MERSSSSDQRRSTGVHTVGDSAAFVDALRRGQDDALGTLVDRYGPRIYNFAARMCRSGEDAKDVMQETFVAALRSLKDFRGEGKLSTWLFRIAVNACRKMHRRGKFEPLHHLSLDELMPSPHEREQLVSADTPERVALRHDLQETLEAGLMSLPPHYRAIVILRDLEGLSTEEAADALGITIVTVKVRLHRARLALRRRLAAAAAGPETKRLHADRMDGQPEDASARKDR